MVNCKTASAITIAALMASVLPAQLRISAAAKAVDLAFPTELAAEFAAIAQATPNFAVPEAVPKGTKIRISSSSDNMNTISALLQKGFEGAYAGSKVDIQTKSVDAALQDVLNDNADLAAISRPLTDAEKAKGLIAVPVRREKIAIVVSKANPFAQSLTGSQFAQIFRGEIKDWAKVGGAAGPIRVIDRAVTSETRQSLQSYPVFKTAPFQTSGNATQLPEESTEALVKALGQNGIGYALVGDVEGQSDLKAIALHQTPPTDPRYPFSQPYSFVYVGGAPESVQAFLGYATGNPGQAALNDANLTGDGVIAAATNNSAGTAGNAENSNGKTGSAVISAVGSTAVGTDAAGNPSSNPTKNGAGNVTDEALGDASGGKLPAGVDVPATDGATDSLTDQGRWWWLLLPLAGLGLLLWAAGKRSPKEETDYLTNTDGANTGSLAAASSDESDEIHSNLNPVAEDDSVTSDAASSDRLSDSNDDPYEASLSTGLSDIPPSISANVPLDQASPMGDRVADVTSATALTGTTAATPDHWAQPTDTAGEGVRTSMQEDVVGVRSRLIDDPDQIEQDQTDQIDLGPIESVGTTPATTATATTTTPPDSDSWLERAKRRINEATEQIPETQTDIQTDIKEDRTYD